MFVDKLEEFFGKFEEGERNWVSDNLDRLDDEKKNKFFSLLKSKHEGKGAPTIYEMGEVFEKVTEKKPRTYFWSVCMECGSEYSYGLPMCPKCYSNGLLCRAYTVKTSEFPPPSKVYKFNKEYISKNERNCYDCPDTELSYCKNFGNEKWECRDFQSCKCAACCVQLKHKNQKLSSGTEEVKQSYAVPLSSLS